jgi:ORF6N domain
MTTSNTVLVPRIEVRIQIIRGLRVMIDVDLAALYGVETKRLNEQVKRNRERFPADFLFQLTPAEKAEVVANCDHLTKLKYSPYLPYAFSEHGAIMLANVLNSHKAVQVSVQIVRTFIRLRELLVTHKDLARKLEEMEKKYDRQFQVVFEAIRQLITPPEKPKKQIGF